MAQEKLDGMRAILHITEIGIRIFSRGAGVSDPTKPLEKTSSLPHLATLCIPGLAGTILDSEILLPNADSATLAGLVNGKNGHGDAHKVKAFVFDVVHNAGEDLTGNRLGSRLKVLDSLKQKLNSLFIQIFSSAYLPDAKQKLYRDILKTGGEGIMLKNLNAVYLQGGRPANNWYKAKKSATYDCVIMGFTRGAGKYNMHIGAVRFGQYLNGNLLEIGQASGMSDVIRAEMTQFPHKYIGKAVIIKGMERLKSGAIRHPQFIGLHPTKDSNECIYYHNEQ
jgi:ATP-dependent DNA ligase